MQDETKGEEKKEEGKAEEKPAEAAKAPEAASLLVKGRVCEDKQKWKSACISLDGLLDYDEEDRWAFHIFPLWKIAIVRSNSSSP